MTLHILILIDAVNKLQGQKNVLITHAFRFNIKEQIIQIEIRKYINI